MTLRAVITICHDEFFVGGGGGVVICRTELDESDCSISSRADP
jgi:hypothetical protein